MQGQKTAAVGWHFMIAFMLFSAQFLVVGNLLIMPVLLLGVQEELALNAWSTGLLLAAFPAMAFVSNLFVGRVIDRIGRPLSVLTGLFTAAGCFLMMCMATNGTVAIVSRALTGLCMPLIGASLYAVIADVYCARSRIRITSLVSTAASLAGLIILPIGAWFSIPSKWQYVFLTFSIACLCLGLICYFAYYRQYASNRLSGATGRQGAVRLYQEDAALRSYALWYWFQGFAYFALMSWIPACFQRLLGGGQSSVVLFVGGLGAVLGAGCLAMVAGKRAGFFHILLGVSGMAVLSLPASVQELWAVSAAWFIYNACRQLLSAHILSGANARCGNADRGVLNATMSVGYQAVGAAAAFLTAQVPFAPYSLSIICIVVTLTILPGFYFYRTLGRADAL
ncbi:MFS transporter [Pseudomonas sp. NPDC087803]|uniref:MFS transporter n=1 Tax=Pseudomonas sp. NPDC087803 TaxID=3364448 RepID=UPI0038012C43